MAKKTSYINPELDMAELQLESWKKFMLENPYDKVEDRKELMKTKTGGAYYAVVQNKEAIQKSLRDTLKEYLALLEIVDKLREREAEKAEARGGANINGMMKDHKK